MRFTEPRPTSPKSEAKPVLKWAGGKRRLLEQYAPYFQRAFSSYYEPFMGGGAVYFWLRSQAQVRPVKAALTDINPELINFYQVLRDRPEALIRKLATHQKRHCQEYYYSIREQDKTELTPLSRAARLLYLNRTCFNGLYRENSQGKFNVPMGRYKNPRILDQEGLLAASESLKGARIEVAPYTAVEQLARPGDLVYFDPPYHPLTETSDFTSYTKQGFTAEDQENLAKLYARLVGQGVNALLSNSDTPLIRSLYREFQQVPIQAARSINSKGDGRHKITELLIVP